jgi:hypothetical protein
MALPSSYPKVATVAPFYMGIAIFIVPGDPTFEIELQRTTDSGGAPNVGAAVTIAQLPPPPKSGVRYRDTLPMDGAKRYYRFRHVRTGWTPGDWTGWTRSAIPGDINNLPANPGISGPPGDPTIGGGSVDRTGLEGVTTTTFGPNGRAQLVFNGDVELGLSYWIARSSASYSPALTDVIANDPAFGLQLNTATPYAGAASLQVNTSGILNAELMQVRRASDDTGESQALVFRVEDDFSFYCQIAAKASVAASMAIRAICYDGSGNFLNFAFLMPQTSITTSWVLYTGVAATPLPAGTKYLMLTIVGVWPGSSTTFHFDNINVWRQIRASDVQAGAITHPLMADGAVGFVELTPSLAASINLGDRSNPLRNPGFEDGLTFWQAATGASVPTNAANAKSGNKYLEITASVTTDVNQVDENAANMYGELAPGATVVYGGWALVVSGTGTAVIKAVTADKDKANRQGHQVTTTAAGVWTYIEGSFTISSTDKYLGFMCELLSPTGSCTVRFDDVFAMVVTPGLPAVAWFDNGSKSANFTIDWKNGNHQRVTLGAAALTISFTNQLPGQAYFLEVVQDATGSRTVTWPGAVIWPGGTAPTLTTTASRADGFTFFYDSVPGTPKYLGQTFGLNYAV